MKILQDTEFLRVSEYLLLFWADIIASEPIVYEDIPNWSVKFKLHIFLFSYNVVQELLPEVYFQTVDEVPRLVLWNSLQELFFKKLWTSNVAADTFMRTENGTPIPWISGVFSSVPLKTA